MSKQHPDNPAPSWVAGPSGFQGGQQPRGAVAGVQSRRPQPRQRQRRAVPAAAHAPAAQPAAAAAAPAGGQQGSIESGMAVRRQAPSELRAKQPCWPLPLPAAVWASVLVLPSLLPARVHPYSTLALLHCCPFTLCYATDLLLQ